MIDGVFSPSCAQKSCSWLFLVIFVFTLTRKKEKNNLHYNFFCIFVFTLMRKKEKNNLLYNNYFGHFGGKIGLLLFTYLTKNSWDYEIRAQELASGAIRMFLAFLSKIWYHFKGGRVSEKSNPTFLPFLKVHDQLQTNGISKRFGAQRQDCTQFVDTLG